MKSQKNPLLKDIMTNYILNLVKNILEIPTKKSEFYSLFGNNS